MAVYKELVLDRKEQDPKKLMTKLYRFSEDLRFTLSNLEYGDNLGKNVIDILNERNGRVRKIDFDNEQLEISFRNAETDTYTALKQQADAIELLVEKGGVVNAMMTRMELYKESIHLKTGQVVFDSTNMKIDALGNAEFTGNILGGSININNRFIVYENGDCYIDDALTVSTLNPTRGVYAAGMEVYNDAGVINTVTGTVSSWETYVTGILSCNRVRFNSDQRLKDGIREISPEQAADVVRSLTPYSFRFRDSRRESIGYIAQDVYGSSGQELPMVGRSGRYLQIPYQNYGAVYAAAIQHNQLRIERLKKRVATFRKGGEDVIL